MTKVKIHEVMNNGLTKVLCILGWDGEKEEIVILQGKRFGEDILSERYVDKRTKEYISAKDGESFIMNLPFALTGQRVYAGTTYEEE